MNATEPLPVALVVSGDARIAQLLAKPDNLVVPARACRLDGFVDDTFTEYADASIYRPSSVCQARLVSSLQDSVRAKGAYYLAFTMYTAAGADESIDIWIGHRTVARAHLETADNRLHLFVVPDSFRFRSGERIRLVSAATGGPHRIENVVFLKRRPQPTPERLEILHPHVDLQRDGDKVQARVTWISSRPASGELLYKSGRTVARTLPVPGPSVNHEILLEDLQANKKQTCEIHLEDETGGLKAVHKESFTTEKFDGRKIAATLPLPCRRSTSRAVDWPVSAGVPFPQSALGSVEQLRLVDSEKREIDLQARPLTLWPDGSVRWALLDFERGNGDLRVEYGREVSRIQSEERLEVAEARTGITVTTGPLRVQFRRDSVALPGLVSLRRTDGSYRRLTPENADPAGRLVTTDGTVYETGRPESVTLEESGPLRVCVRIEVRHRSVAGVSLFRSIFRVHLFRGRGEIRLLHTFENDRTEEEFIRIRSLALRADFDLGEKVEGRIDRNSVASLTSRPLSLRQTHDNRCELVRGSRLIRKGRRSEGSAELRGEESVSLAVRDFWQNYPKGIEIDERGITLQICPSLKRNAYSPGGEEEDKLYYYLKDGSYEFKHGVARTHEFWFRCGPGSGDLATSVQNPPLYAPSLSAFNRSRAFGQLPAKDPSPFAPYEEWVEAARTAYAGDRQASRAYGMLNYGDWFGERSYNWGNQEYDAAWCFLQEYLRGGHSDFYTWAGEAARHTSDVDTCHHSPRLGGVGEQYVHCVGHVGGYYPEGYRERAIFSGRWSPSHTWVEGLFLHHLLSGDARIRECALKTCDLLVGDQLNHYDFSNCRNSGWHLIHLSAAYRATGRRVYLNAARIVVERVLERQRSSGGWDRLMVPGHCYCDPPRHTGNAGFMVGILMVGLKRYHEATGDRRVARAIVAAAGYCIDSMWVPEKSAFRYTACPHSSVGGGADMRILKGVAAAYRFSREERFREILLAGVESALAGRHPRAHRGVGKSICSPMRGAPQVLVELEG